MRRALGWLLIVLTLLPAWARAQTKEQQLKQAELHFDHGEYDTARAVAEDLINRNVLASVDDIIEANRIAGLCWFYSTAKNRKEKAAEYFLNLLRASPDYQMDPFFTLPAAVQFFDDLKQQHGEELELRRREIREEEDRRRHERDRPAPPKIQIVNRDLERHDRLLAFAPFGIGQFQNHDDGLGTVLETVQIASGAVSLGSAIAVFAMKQEAQDKLQNPCATSGGSCGPYQTAQGLNTTAVIAGGLFFATWGVGVIQALSAFQPEVVTTSPGKIVDVGPPRASLVTPFVAPVSGGGVLGMNLGF